MYNEIFGESIVKEKFLFRFDVKLMFFDVLDLSFFEFMVNSLFFVLFGYEIVVNVLVLIVLCLVEYFEC